MTTTRLEEAWASGKPGVLSNVMLPSTLVAETVQRAGADGVLFDMQHGHIGVGDLVGLCQVVGMLGGTPFVRVPTADPWIIMRALDAGAVGIVSPLVNTPEEAQRLVDACLYPPRGGRSYGPLRPAVWGPTDDFTTTANDRVLPFAMIETREGIDNLEAILSVPGLAGAVIGPTDFGGGIGFGYVFDREEPEVLELFQKVVDTARSNGIHAGIFTGSPDYSQRMIEMGFDFVMMGGDLASIGVGAATSIAALRSTAEAAGSSAPY